MNTDERPEDWPWPANSTDEHMRSGVSIGGDRYYHAEFWLPDGDRIMGLPAHAPYPADGVFIGVHEHHRSRNIGSEDLWCGGYLWFENVAKAKELEAAGRGVARHTLVSASPLTIAPSIGCNGCPSHGYIERGRWRDA